MPESHGRAKAERKRQQRNKERVAEKRRERAQTVATPGASNRWVVPSFITTGLLGVLWLLVYYVAGNKIEAMRNLGNWNVLIGIVLFMASFVIASFWK